MSNSIKIEHPSKLIPSTTYNDMKFKEKGRVINIGNSNNTYVANINGNEKVKKLFSINNANNYVYLGSTNTSLLNNMGITLEDDGSLLLIKGRSYDLFTGLYHKHLKGGFKYEGFNIEVESGENIKFKELYVDADGSLIGRKRDSNKTLEEDIFYKINFQKIKKEYDLVTLNQENTDSKFIVEYEVYTPKENEEQDLSSINNIVEKKENNILKINREGMNIEIELKNNQIFTKGLPAILESVGDEVDGKEKEYKVKLPLKGKDKILAIKPISNQIQLVVDKGNKIKIYYLDPLNIFALKDYQYEVTRLTQEPPLSLYSMVGENNYKNYHPGQPFSSQTIGNFSSRHIPFFSSLIDNSRIHINKAKQQYALKKYKAMASNIAKGIDPGFRGLFSNIKQLVNSSISPYENKSKALDGARKSISKSYAILNKVVKGINNGKTQGEVVYSVVEKLKRKEKITFNNYNEIRLFLGMNIFNFPNDIGVNIFSLMSHSKQHSLTLSINENNEVIFSFINKKNTDVSIGLSAGIKAYKQQSDINNISSDAVVPVMASTVLNFNYDNKSNFSFGVRLENIVSFIDNKLDLTEESLKNNATLDNSKETTVSVISEIRAEVSVDVEVAINSDAGVTIPRNVLGINIAATLVKFSTSINKFIGHGKFDSNDHNRKVFINLFYFAFNLYRDLKFMPSSSTSSNNNIQWYPLATVKNFELMIQKKINDLLRIPVFDSEELKRKNEFENNKRNLKGIYKRILKINKLFDNHPGEYQVSSDIDRLNEIYLNLSSNKEFKNKLGEGKKISENPQIEQFLADIKSRKKTMSSQKKDNMNEKYKPYIICNYLLNEKNKNSYDKAKLKITHLVEEIMNSREVKANEFKEKLDSLYTECKQSLEKLEYQLESIDLKSISELVNKEKSLPIIFFRFQSQDAIIHEQVKGKIKFEYDSNGSQLNKILTEYYF